MLWQNKIEIFQKGFIGLPIFPCHGLSEIHASTILSSVARPEPTPPFALLLARAAAARFRLWLGSQLQSQYELKKFIALTEEFWQTQSPQNRGGGGRLRQHWYCLILTAAVPPQSAAWCRIKSVSELISEASAWADVPATSNSISSPRTGSTNYVHIVRVWWPCFREAQNLEDDQACFRRAHIGTSWKKGKRARISRR